MLRSHAAISFDCPIPALKTSNVCDFTAEHSHVAVLGCLKYTGTDKVVHVHSLLFLLCNSCGNVDPKGILADLMFIVLTMKVDRISFKLKPQESDKPHTLAIIWRGFAMSCKMLTS
jgi:hypothetical protein